MDASERRALARRVGRVAFARKTDEERSAFARVGGLANGARMKREAAERAAKASGDPTRYFSGPAPSRAEVEEFIPAVLTDHDDWLPTEDRALREAGRRRTIWMLTQGGKS